MRQIRDRGEDQPHGRRETSDFVQDDPSEMLLIARLMRTLSNDLGALTFGVFVKLERSS